MHKKLIPLLFLASPVFAGEALVLSTLPEYTSVESRIENCPEVRAIPMPELASTVPLNPKLRTDNPFVDPTAKPISAIYNSVYRNKATSAPKDEAPATKEDSVPDVIACTWQASTEKQLKGYRTFIQFEGKDYTFLSDKEHTFGTILHGQIRNGQFEELPKPMSDLEKKLKDAEQPVKQKQAHSKAPNLI